MSDYRKQEASKARRQNAWDLLKETRNPEYVALRYGYPVKTMRDALAKIPKTDKAYKRSDTAKRIHSGLTRASELLPEIDNGKGIPGGKASADGST